MDRDQDCDDTPYTNQDRDTMLCTWQWWACAYCLDRVGEAFKVDHLNGDCTDNSYANLVACCGDCHNRKTQACRMQGTSEEEARLLSTMLAAAKRNKAEWGEPQQWLLVRNGFDTAK
jgi:hypothetical protein